MAPHRRSYPNTNPPPPRYVPQHQTPPQTVVPQHHHPPPRYVQQDFGHLLASIAVAAQLQRYTTHVLHHMPDDQVAAVAGALTLRVLQRTRPERVDLTVGQCRHRH